jgi:hypothetical protein
MISITRLTLVAPPFVLSVATGLPTVVGTWGEVIILSAGVYDRGVDAGRSLRKIDAAKNQNRYLDAGRNNGTIG